MKSLKESLFDQDLVKKPIISLFDIAKNHLFAVKRYEFAKNSLHRFIDDTSLNKLWKKEGSPIMMSTHISSSSYSGYENKVLSTIFSHAAVNKEGEIDNDMLNRWLNENDVLTEFQIAPAKWSDTYIEVFFINPREKGAWMHKNFNSGPFQRECYEIEIRFKDKETKGLRLAFELCLNIKWNQMDALLLNSK